MAAQKQLVKPVGVTSPYLEMLPADNGPYRHPKPLDSDNYIYPFIKTWKPWDEMLI